MDDRQETEDGFGLDVLVALYVLAQAGKMEERMDMRVDEEWLSKRREGVSKNYIEGPKNVRSQKKEESRV